jgi:CelD/BcsL family acetyltransferase involved in cellulose biosynthesis
MRYSLISPADLDTGLRGRWAELTASDPALGSPFFSPEFTRAVASVRDDVRIVVMEEDAAVVGFFPFQRGHLGRGRPVGGPFSDQHGLVVAGGTEIDVRDVLRAARLSSWHFDHVLAEQKPFVPYTARLATSPILDLSSGFDGYVRSRQAAGSRRIEQIDRKTRKLERETGPLRWVARSTDVGALHEVIAAKSRQCRSAGIPDIFEPMWTRQLIRRILAVDVPGFAGCLSCLYAGDSLVAAHAGMRTDRVWHWWFPTYDQAFARYSPGLILLLQLAREAAALGMAAVDLGKGDDPYKQSFANAQIALAEGLVSRTPVSTVVRNLHEQAELRLRSSRLADPMRPALRRGNQWVRQRRFR